MRSIALRMREETVETVEVSLHPSFTQLKQGVNGRDWRFLNAPCQAWPSLAAILILAWSADFSPQQRSKTQRPHPLLRTEVRAPGRPSPQNENWSKPGFWACFVHESRNLSAD